MLAALNRGGVQRTSWFFGSEAGATPRIDAE